MGFKNFGSVAPSKGGNKFKEGNHIVMVNRFRTDTSRKGVGMAVLECKIIETDNDQVKPGSSADVLYMDNEEASVADLKRVLMTVLEEDDAEAIDEDRIEKIAADDELVGFLLKCEAYPYTTKKNKKDIVLCKWNMTSPSDQQRAAKKALDLGIMTPEMASVYLPKTAAAK